MVSPLQHCPTSCSLLAINTPQALLRRARLLTGCSTRFNYQTSCRSLRQSNLCTAATSPCRVLPWCLSKPGARSLTLRTQSQHVAKAATVERTNLEEQSTPSQSTAYPFSDIEKKWQKYWIEHKTFRTPDFSELDTSKPKAYILDMFPYPS